MQIANARRQMAALSVRRKGKAIALKVRCDRQIIKRSLALHLKDLSKRILHP